MSLVVGLMLAMAVCLLPMQASAEVIVPPVPIDRERGAVQEPPAADDGTVTQQATRGTYRSPSGSFSGGGARSGVTTGGGGTYRTGPRAPSSNVTRPPNTGYGSPGGGFGRAGSFFGGLAAGALLGHLFNPFAGFGWGWGSGYGGFGFGWSFISLIFWAVLLFVAYRLVRRLFGGGGRGRDGGRYR